MSSLIRYMSNKVNILFPGLDIIGLYRLCGSETKKKMLRETFEADPEAVDLSSENVPDINVITSKDTIL